MIGVCDSGLGGLTLLKGLHERYPHTDILYYGDTKNMPYGSKTKSELIDIFDHIKSYFVKRNCSDIIVACNTLCSAIKLEDEKIKIHDIIEKTVERISRSNVKKVIVFATPFTIKSARYQSLLESKGIKTLAVPLPSLAKDIEDGLDRALIRDKIFKVFEKLDNKGVEAIVLGCTHYPIYKDIFNEYYNVPIFDSLNLDFGIKSASEDGIIEIHMEKSLKLDEMMKKMGVEFIYEENRASKR